MKRPASARPVSASVGTKESLAVSLVAMLAGIGAGVVSAEPTGEALWDFALKFSFAFVVVLAASKAPRWSTIVTAAIAAAMSFLTLGAVLAWVALAVAVATSLLDRRSKLFGAVAGALAVLALLLLPSVGFFGLQSIVALIAVLPVLVSGYRFGSRRARQVARWSGASLVLVCGVILLVGGLSLVNARSDVESGVAAARRGLNAAREGSTQAVVEELSRAEQALDSAQRRVSAPSVRVLRLLPIASQHQRAIEIATSEGAEVARQAAAIVRDADISLISLEAGAVDLNALAQMAPQLRDTSGSLSAALASIGEIDSRWLVSGLNRQIRLLADEIEVLLPEIDLAASAAEVVPGLLGANDQRTYFVMFGTPAESRELGGFLGSWALVSFDQGRLLVGESGRINELYDVAAANSIEPGTASRWIEEYSRPTKYPQNLPSSPDMAAVAEVSRQVLAGATPETIDGFVYMDALALTSFLELTGPVTIPFQTEPLSTANASQFFFVDQYRFDSSDRSEVFDELAAVAGAVIDEIGRQVLPGPEELGRVLGPAARAGHLQVVTFDGRENEFLRSIKLLRDFGRDETEDFVALVQANALPNKMDLYLHRTLEYHADVAESGALTATATATLRSVVPADAPEFTLGKGDQVGFNKVLLSLYTPHELISVRLNGESVPVASAVEFGLQRYLVEVLVAPTGEAYEVQYVVAGAVARSNSYSLEVWHQPLVNSDEVTVSVVGEQTIAWNGTLLENVIVE